MNTTARTAMNCRHDLSAAAWPSVQSLISRLPVNEPTPTAREWAQSLRDLESHCREAVDAFAAAIIHDPALPLKFAYGLLLPTLANAGAILAERAEAFGEPVHETEFRLADVLRTADPAALPPSSVRAMRKSLVATLASLAGTGRGVVAAVPFAWDEATRGEVLRMTEAVAAAAEQIEALTAAEHDDGLDSGYSIPARSADLTLAPFGVDKRDPAFADSRAALTLHNFLFESEIGALELCAENILLGTSMPREFIVDMAAQCFDEARHATALISRLPVYGAELASFPVSLRSWTRSRGLSLAQRLTVHQRLGEWLGVDVLIASSAKYIGLGDVQTAHLMQFMARDEIRHVAFGNKWLRWFEANGHLTVEEIDRWAHEYRNSYGQGMANFSAIPVNEQECFDAGFTAREVDALKDARAAR